jgi:hypothetical protein
VRGLFKRAGTWQVIRGIAATTAAVVARKSLARSWRAVMGSSPPKYPVRSSVCWRDAVLWAAASAAVGATARLAARELSGRVQLRLTGEEPTP